jgi:hypothetical protein
MYCELMAEHGDGAGAATRVAQWHVVRQDQHSALCGHVLARDAQTVSIVARPRPPDGICRTCWSNYQALAA